MLRTILWPGWFPEKTLQKIFCYIVLLNSYVLSIFRVPQTLANAHKNHNIKVLQDQFLVRNRNWLNYANIGSECRTFQVKQVCTCACAHAEPWVHPHLELTKRWCVILAWSPWTKQSLLFSSWGWVSHPVFSTKYCRNRSQITHCHRFKTAFLLTQVRWKSSAWEAPAWWRGRACFRHTGRAAGTIVPGQTASAGSSQVHRFLTMNLWWWLMSSDQIYIQWGAQVIFNF